MSSAIGSVMFSSLLSVSLKPCHEPKRVSSIKTANKSGEVGGTEVENDL